MGWHNPPISWAELERRMSGRAEPRLPPTEDNPEGDSAPGFTRRRTHYRPHPLPERPNEPLVPYAELHCHSDFSFLDGASDPE